MSAWTPSWARQLGTSSGERSRQCCARLDWRSPLIFLPLAQPPTLGALDTAAGRTSRVLQGPMHLRCLSQLDLSASDCPVCQRRYREVVYAYPPTVLARRVVNKAMQDGARMVLVVPPAVTAEYWQKLRQHSVINNAERYLRVKNASRSLRQWSEDDPKDLAVFSCNFSGVASEADCAPGAGCVGAVARRVRRPYGGGQDEEDRLRCGMRCFGGWMRTGRSG